MVSKRVLVPDAKLLFHIRKIVNASGADVSLDHVGVTDRLRVTCREYNRRYPDVARFRALVKVGLEQVNGENNQKNDYRNEEAPVLSAAKKRRLKEEEDYEREAAEEDARRAYSATSMSLNAGLRQRYAEKSQRDIQERAEKEATAAEEEGDAKAAETTNNKSKDNDGTNVSTTDNVTATPRTNKKKKKLKKRRSTVTGPHANNNDDDDVSSPTSSSLDLVPKIPRERYADLGGMDTTLTQIRELVEYPLRHPELFAHLGVDPPRGVLLRGPPGVGKTHLANAVAGEIGVTFYSISAPEIIGGVSGESEQRVRHLFRTAAASAPALIFIDEIDAVAPKRGDGGRSGGGGNSMEKRIVAQLLTCMDSLADVNVMVIGATNRPDAIDPALRRAGRFDREIRLGVPDERAREAILRRSTERMRLENEGGEFDFAVVAKKTPGFVGADLRSLAKEAAVVAINRIFKMVLMTNANTNTNATQGEGEGDEDGDVVMTPPPSESDDAKSSLSPPPSSSHTTLTPSQLAPLYITMSDFLAAIPSVQPSSKREGFATVPNVTWDHVGALRDLRDELTLSVLEPIHHPERFKALGLPLPAGVLLYGPPGCGKTLLAKAISHESGANFISVKGPELLDKYVGESERAVRQVFERARSSSPCVVFFDELDSLCPRRGSGSDGGGGSGVSERVVNQLLTEMDGLDDRNSVFVIAATNRPELIDPAMLRPGRLDKLLYVPLPSPQDRVSIVKALARKVALAPDVDLAAVATDSRANGYSGADCAALLREAGLAVLRDRDHGHDEDGPPSLRITAKHFDYAFAHVKPSVSKKDQAKYDRVRDRMARARTRGGVVETNEGTGGNNSNNDDDNGAKSADDKMSVRERPQKGDNGE